MVGMKMGETTKWSNIAFGRIPLKLPTSSMPNVNLTTVNSNILNNNKTEELAANLLNHQRYRTELSLNIADYSCIPKSTVRLIRFLINAPSSAHRKARS